MTSSVAAAARAVTRITAPVTSPTVPAVSAVQHISLTITDLERSTEWYQRVLGFHHVRSATVGGFSLSVLASPGDELSLTLSKHPDNPGRQFSETRTGLDHLSFTVADMDSLKTWTDHFDRQGVVHSPAAEDPFGVVLVFRDPDNIQLELVVPLGRS
jgi:glyoxylase I family protein